LLKMIEEPPADTLFILVAENEGEILSTILSRCQLVKIPALEVCDIEHNLLAKKACTAEQAKQIANASDGDLREALNLIQHADEDFHGLLREWLNSSLKNQTVTQVKLIEEIGRMGREKQKQFLKHFTHLLEQAVRLQVADDVLKDRLLNRMSEGEKDFVARLNKAMTLEQKEAIAEELDKATYYIERNANAKILFHALTIKIFHIVKNNVVISV
jgi:DNA polymerase III subunit delta'